MIKGVNRPSIFYDLTGLAYAGLVSVGRESDSTIRLDCPEVPFLLSRKHAKISVQTNGILVLRDLNSTNGTYISRVGEFLRRLRPDENWELKRGDMIGFGGPETIVARSEAPDITVPNPFLFRYTALDGDSEDDSDSANNSSAEPQAVVTITCQVRSRKFSEIDPRDRQEDMDYEDASTVLPDKDRKKPRTTVTAKDIAGMLANHLTCSICHDWLAGAHALTCGHMFCGICLAGWVTEKQSCPECRSRTAGVPIRCRNVDNAISEIFGQDLVSPNSKRERRRKELVWTEVGDSVQEAWTTAMQKCRKQAADPASQHSSLTGQPAVQPATNMFTHAIAAAQHFRTSEHGASGNNAPRANHGGSGAAPRQGR